MEIIRRKIHKRRLCKMIFGIFTRQHSVRCVALTLVIVIFLVYEFKELYEKFQKERRFSYYTSFVEEINTFADKVELSDNKSSHHTLRLSKLLQVSLKMRHNNNNKNGNVER